MMETHSTSNHRHAKRWEFSDPKLEALACVIEDQGDYNISKAFNAFVNDESDVEDAARRLRARVQTDAEPVAIRQWRRVGSYDGPKEALEWRDHEGGDAQWESWAEYDSFERRIVYTHPVCEEKTKLTEEDVIYIRTSPKSARQIARERGWDSSHVSEVRRGMWWKHVPLRPATLTIKEPESE